ncbi:hypothetical protein BJ878DRAFT_534450 [Calycina marina]|uniref:Altered inheritance of mitochondria protein 9, mitochondrial n=1 Tax=Calycina marina TaxID=1763456 RepID=A0A9P7Z3H1_9HELO|nr:hypothetical protein BJ878DRAFT_534450 [Calycina marina]
MPRARYSEHVPILEDESTSDSETDSLFDNEADSETDTDQYSVPAEVATDPYNYTTGHWLNRDLLQREARYVKFDFPALCKKAVDTCSGATKVIRYKKKEGGFNRVFIPYLDNGERVVARGPFRIAGPRRLVTNSEVATMTYVLDWSDDDNNSIGTEYIIMEHVPGAQLHDKWPSMSPHQHMLCVKRVAFIVTEMAKLPFPAYGSLYFANAPIDPKSKLEFAEGFCIGPHWTELPSYCSGLIDAGFSRIPKSNGSVEELPYRGSVQEHLHLLNISEKVVRKLIKAPIIQQVASPTLLHPDLHKRNIYVSEEDPSCVTAITDWQSTKEEAARKRHEKDVWTCRQTFEVVIKGYIPKLHNARAMDQTLLGPFCYCDASWRDSAAALRQELIEVSQRWTELGLPGSCPFQLKLEELAEHAKQYEDFESAQQSKMFLKRALDADSDGWVPAENWETAKQGHEIMCLPTLSSLLSAAPSHWITHLRSFSTNNQP